MQHTTLMLECNKLLDSGTAPWKERSTVGVDEEGGEEMDGEEEEEMPTREDLAASTTSCWDTIFLFIMGSTVIKPPSDRVVSLLTRGELMVVHEYDFLLLVCRA
jgi:hypothetical protein